MRRIRLAAFALTVALTCAWVAAFASWLHRRQAITPIQPSPYVERRTPYVVLGTPNAAKPYVASIRQDSKTYHLRECSKFGKSLKVIKEYASEEEAEADGKQPCSYCLPQRIARAK